MVRALYVFILLMLGCSALTVAQAGYKKVSICRVLAEPGRYQSKHIVADADLVIARPHGVFLSDQLCPKMGLALEFPQSDEDESVANLEMSIRNGKLPSVTSGKFYGEVVRGPKANHPVLVLRLVQNLQPKSESVIQPDTKMAMPDMPMPSSDKHP